MYDTDQEYADDLIDEGRFTNSNDVIQESFKLLREQEQKIFILELAIVQGVDSGESVVFDMDKILEDARKNGGLKNV